VKIFPAATLGPRYIKDLRGPFPDARLVPSGGVDSTNAQAFLEHGAFAVCCGTEVVPPSVVAAGGHEEIRARAERFVARLGGPSD
jgi:2-dehydro-3-deoxyphosphogluconate aldolase/(4S)-4-hydroxy-2-oxoglutarate aldolase